MKAPVVRVLLSFAVTRTPDNTLITFARNVLALLYKQAAITGIPVPAAVLEAAITAFADAKAAQANGGKAATALKDAKRADLVKRLRSLALFVQRTCNNDLAWVLSTGFGVVSRNRASSPLSKPVILRIVNGREGETLVTLSRERNARCCQVRVAEIGADGAPGEFRPVVFSTSSRNISISGLIPGVLYAYQGRTLGGTTVYSDWSDQITQRAA